MKFSVYTTTKDRSLCEAQEGVLGQEEIVDDRKERFDWYTRSIS